MLETVFSICSLLAMAGWLLLAVLPRWQPTAHLIAPLVIPALIGIVYTGLMATHIGAAPEGSGFGSLAEVKALFTVDALILAGWVHYLAFDLFVGAWEVRDAQRAGVHHLLVVPCLLATLMAGPAGLVLYLLIRQGVRLASGGQQPAEAVA